MLHAVFYFEDWTQHVGASEPKATILRWLHNMKTLGVDKLWMIDKTTFQIGQYYSHHDANIQFERVTCLSEICEKLSGEDIEWVFLELVRSMPDKENSVSLVGFAPPENAIYIVGGDACGIEIPEGENPDNVCHWVHVPMAIDLSFYAETTMAIALWNRVINNTESE